jgi:hypothetical protein
LSNTFRIKSKTGEAGKNSIFSLFDKVINVDAVPVRYIPQVLFISMMGIIYIGNSHYTEKTIRKIAKIQVEVEELRADYTSLKADYMFESKQSEVAKKVMELGLEESTKPPFKLELK